jgi:hypothetical protein
MSIIKKQDIITKEAEKALQPLIDDYAKLDAEQQKLIESSKIYQKILADIKKTNDGSEAKKLVAVNQQLVKTNQELTALDKEKIRLDKEKERVLAKLANAQSKENKELVENKLELQKTNREIKENTELTSKQTSAYRKLTIQTNKAQKEFKELAAQFGVSSKQAQSALTRFNKLDNSLRNINKAAKDGRRDVGRYNTALKGIGTQLLGAAGIVGGIDLLVDGIREFNKTATQLNDLSRKITSNLGATGVEADRLAARINGIATVFEEDYNEVLQAANVVSKEFGITGQEATKLIEEGFLKGSNNSGEFLDILKEYPVQLQSIGLNAEESFALINQQVTSGVYSDKGIDALKEAGIRLRENTKAVQQSLSVFDEDTRAQIENAVARGEVFEATQLISKGLDDNSLTAQQVQEVISNVFGGAGEDAMSFVMSLDEVKLSLDDVAIQSSEAEQASLNLSQSWNRFVAGVSDSDGIFGKVFAKLKNLLAGAINSLTFLIDKLSGGDKAIDKIKAAVERLKIEQQELNKETDKGTNSLNKNTNAVNRNITSNKKRTTELESERKAAEKARKEYEKLQQQRDRDRLPGGQVSPITSPAMTGAAFNPQTEAQKLTKVLADQEKKRTEDKAEETKKRLELEQLYNEALVELSLSSLETVSGLIQEGIQQDTQAQIDAIQARADADKAILQDQLDKGLITKEEFAKKSEAIDKKARQDSAKAQKQGSLYQIGIDTAAGIVKALASSAPPANFINAGLVAAQGAIQAALVAARPIPQFEEGGIIGGKRHSQGGTLIEAEKGEYVINRKGYANAPMMTEMINKGLISDTDALGMNKVQRSNLLANLLMQGNKVNEQVLQALLNGGYSIPTKNGVIEKRFDGQIIKHNG